MSQKRKNQAGLTDQPIMQRADLGCSRFKGKNVVVTAGTMGIGRAIVERLCQEGARVFLCSRKAKNVEETIAELSNQGFLVSGCTCHVGKPEELKKFVEKAVEYFNGEIHGIVSNAAVNPVSGPTLDLAEDVNGGSIVFISSVGGFQPAPPLGIYGMSKTAVIALARVLSVDLGPQNIRVNAIAPGLIRTKMSEMFWRSSASESQRLATSLKRLGDPEDIAGTTAYFLSEDSAYVTGETVVVNGGGNSRM